MEGALEANGTRSQLHLLWILRQSLNKTSECRLFYNKIVQEQKVL